MPSLPAVRRLVVVGGGAAGMSAASAARRVDAGLEIVVLESTGYVAYGLCGIPYYLAGLVERAEDCSPTRPPTSPSAAGWTCACTPRSSGSMRTAAR